MSYKELKTRIKHKCKTLEDWKKIQPGEFKLLYGEICYGIDTETNKISIKIGNNPDGEVDFTDLKWMDADTSWNSIKKKPTDLLTRGANTTADLEDENPDNDAKLPYTSAVKKYISNQKFAKAEQIPDVSKFLTKIPEEYITESELEEKGYATKDEIPTIPEPPDMSLYLPTAQKNAKNGVAPLDDNKKVPVANLPKLTDSEEVISTISESNHTADYIPDANAVYNYSQEILNQAKNYLDDQKGQVNGIVPLNNSAKIDERYLPSYVDDILEGYYNEGSFYEDNNFSKTIAGESGKVYVDLTNNKIYRWSGSAFVEIPHLPNIVEEITENSTNTEVAGAKAIADYVKFKNPIKEITVPTHVAELDPGMYYVNGDYLGAGGTEGRIILSNINEKNEIVDGYVELLSGYIVIQNSFSELSIEDGIEYRILSYTANGYLNTSNHFNAEGWLDYYYVTDTTSGINCPLGYAIKVLREDVLAESNIPNAEVNKWYSGLDFITTSNLTTWDLTDDFQQGSKFDVPTTKGVYNFAVKNQADYKEWEEDKPSYVKNKPFYTEYIPQGEVKVLVRQGDSESGVSNTVDDIDYVPSINNKFNIRGSYTLELEDAPWYDMEYRRLEPIYDEDLQGYLIGNASLYNNKYENTNEIICISIYYDEYKTLIYKVYARYYWGNFTLELLPPEEEVIHHIDQKYLPYYSEYEEQQYVLEPVTLDCQSSVSSEGYILYVNEGQTNGIPVSEFLHLFFEGQKYKVNYDNKYYICEPYLMTDDNATIALGNLKFLGEEDYPGDEPFGIMLGLGSEEDNFFIMYQLASLEQGTHTISIEYLDKDVTIVKDNALELIESDEEGYSIASKDYSSYFTHIWSQYSFYLMAENNMECKVTFNGQEYISKWKNYGDSYLLGNLAFIDSEVYNDTKENFILQIDEGGIANIYTTLPAGTYNWKIEINGYPKREINIEKIPNKYIDIYVPYTSDGNTTTFETDIHFQTRGLIGEEPTADLATTLLHLYESIDEKPHLKYGGKYYSNGSYYIYDNAHGWSTGAAPNGYYSWTEGNLDRYWLTETMYQHGAKLVVEEVNSGKSTRTNICLEISINNEYEVQRYVNEISNGTRQILEIQFVDYSNTYLIKPTSVYPMGTNSLRIEFSFLDYNNQFSVELDQNERKIYSIKFLGFYGDYAHSQNSGYAMGKNSSAEGNNTVALGEDQHAQGRYNKLDGEGKYAHIVGNGLTLNSRSNAYTLDWEGNGNYSGTVTAKKFIAEEEEAFGKFTDSYFVLNDISNGLNYAIQMKNGEIISTELPVRIQIKQNPTKINYYFGEVFDSTGIIVEAVYNDGTTKLVEDFSTNYDNKTLESTGGVQITVKAKLPSIFTTTLTVSVTEFNDTTILQDFIYSQPNSNEFQLQGWKETYNGVSGTELIVPDYSVIVP